MSISKHSYASMLGAYYEMRPPTVWHPQGYIMNARYADLVAKYLQALDTGYEKPVYSAKTALVSYERRQQLWMDTKNLWHGLTFHLFDFAPSEK